MSDLLGGMVWFVIPFALATALGLAGNALNVAITADDANNGLVPPRCRDRVARPKWRHGDYRHAHDGHSLHRLG